MSRALLLRIAAILCIITCLGHTVGTFMAIPDEQVAMKETVSIMQRTMVPMPVGTSRTYMQILDGNNLCTSLLLLLLGVILFSIAPFPKTSMVDRVIGIAAVALTGFAVISAIYFFPVPVVTTALASALSLFARTKS
ncbi:MAG: LIC_13387 family protein [Prosthecobacter sp.]|uniref:LIC_13387 family protein n=1 Tax=Prosthecobacter sp. TaxID=1965333 RepID=UPI0038FE5890